MRKTIHALFFLLLLVPLSVIAQGSYTAETSDKKYIFVVRRADEPDFFVGNQYKQSGMYPNDGSTEPLWTIDWRQRVYLPDDGKHVVRVGKLLYTSTYNEEVFAFFAEGKKLKTYRVNELIDFPYLLPHSSAGYLINYASMVPGSGKDGVLMRIDRGDGYTLNSGAAIDNEKQTLGIETCHGDNYVFDLQTGNVISAERPSRNLALALFAFLVAAYAVYLFFAARGKLTQTVLKLAHCGAGFSVTLCLFLIPVISILPYKIQCVSPLPDYPDFWSCCYLSVSMLPQYLLTSLNVVSPAVNNFHDYSVEANLYWFVFFWLPLIAFFAGISHFLISFIETRTRYRFIDIA